MRLEAGKTSDVHRGRLVGRLRELIDALERRVPRPERANEARIARDAEDLKVRACAQIAQLEP